MSDKRSHERFRIEVDVTLVYEGAEYPGRSRDMGLGGVFVHSDASVPFGADLHVRIALPRLKEPALIPATVRWHARGGMGLQWRSLRAREVWALNRLFRGVTAATS